MKKIFIIYRIFFCLSWLILTSIRHDLEKKQMRFIAFVFYIYSPRWTIQQICSTLSCLFMISLLFRFISSLTIKKNQSHLLWVTHMCNSINHLSILYKVFLSTINIRLFSFSSSMEWVISMKSWLTLSVPNMTVSQFLIEIIHSIDEISFIFLLHTMSYCSIATETIVHNMNRNTFSSIDYFLQPVGRLSFIRHREIVSCC